MVAFVNEYTTDRRTFAGLTIGTLPRERPAAHAFGTSTEVALLTCRGPFPPGRYPLGALAISPFDPKAPQPQATVTSGDLVSGADWVVVDPGCPNGMVPPQKSAFRLVATRGNLQLHHRKR